MQNRPDAEGAVSLRGDQIPVVRGEAEACAFGGFQLDELATEGCVPHVP
jgi:hypothetical protein